MRTHSFDEQIPGEHVESSPSDALESPVHRLAPPVAPHADTKAPHGRLLRRMLRILRRRVSRRAALRVLAIEQGLIGRQREPSDISYAEKVVYAQGTTAAHRLIARYQRSLNRLAARTDDLKVQQCSLRLRAESCGGEIIRHPDGGASSVAAAVREQDRQRAAIAADISGGSHRHWRIPRALRLVPPLVLAADALLLLYFFSGITNVDWSSPLSAALGFAVLLAGMVTGISFGFFRFAGDRLRHYKNDAGTIPLRGLDEATAVAALMALAAMVVLAVMMFARMRTEVVDALGPGSGPTAAIISLTLAVVSVLANTLVVGVHALNGSIETDRLHALGKTVAGPLIQARRQSERADHLELRIAALARKADRIATKSITKAGHKRAAADRLVDAARAAHQGAGPISDPAVDPNTHNHVSGYHSADAIPAADERPLRLAQHHVSTPLTGGS